MDNDEWFRVEAIVKRTSHSRAIDVVLAIKGLLTEMGFKDTSVEWFWGDEPATSCRSDTSPKRR